MRLFFILLFVIPVNLYSYQSGKRRYWLEMNFYLVTSDKIFDGRRKLIEMEYYEYIEKRLEIEFGFKIAYGIWMEFLLPVAGREMDFADVDVGFTGNQLEIYPFISDINDSGIGDMKVKIGGSYHITENFSGGFLFDFKLPTGSSSLGNGRIPLGTGQADTGFYITGSLFSDSFNGELALGYILRTYGEPSYIVYYPLPGTIGKGIDPGDEINLNVKIAFKIKGPFWGGIDFNFTTTQGDGIKFLVLEDEELREVWGYYDASTIAYLKPFLSLKTKEGFRSRIGFSLPVLGKNYPSEPLFPFLRNFPLFPSTGISASVGYNF